MPGTSTARGPRVLNVAAGVETSESPAPRRDARHDALRVLVGKWINAGHTIGAPEAPAVPILTSDVYEWAPGGFFVVHSAYGKIGETSVGGVEVIGVDGDGDGYRSILYDSFGNVHVSRMKIEGDVITWAGDRTRCVATITDAGMVARHQVRAGGGDWRASMDVTLRKIT